MAFWPQTSSFSFDRDFIINHRKYCVWQEPALFVNHSYFIFKNSSKCRSIIFYKGLSKNDVDSFWGLFPILSILSLICNHIYFHIFYANIIIFRVSHNVLKNKYNEHRKDYIGIVYVISLHFRENFICNQFVCTVCS